MADSATKAPLRVFIACGEPSGDALAFEVIRQLRKIAFAQNKVIYFYGVCGPKMRLARVRALFDMRAISVMGFWEVIKHLPRLLRIRREILSKVLELDPDLFLSIDCPDFYLPIAKKIKNQSTNIF